MKHSILLFLFLGLLGTLSAQFNYNNGGRKIKGNGNVTTETRSPSSSFMGIEAGTSIKVELTQSSQTSVRVEAEENILPHVVTEVSGRELRIHFAKGVSIKANKTVTVYVTMPKLISIKAGSASSVTTTSAFKGTDLRIDCGSSAQIEVGFNGATVHAEAGSAGRVELSGSTNNVRLEASSAGVIDASNLKAQTARAEANSAGSLSVYASERIDAAASSAGNIRYSGNPEKVVVDTSSAGRVSKSNF